MAATDRVRYETNQYHDHRCRPGRLCSLVGRTGLLLVCLLRGVASHKKRLPTQFASSSIIITIFMRPQMTSPNWSVLYRLGPCNGFGCSLFQTFSRRRIKWRPTDRVGYETRSEL